MVGWKLHIDILLDVLSAAELKTMSQMVKTCRSLHCEGGKALLRSTDVELYTRLQIMSFLLFMHADAPGRFPSLRALRLEPRVSLPMESAMLLAGFFVELAGRCSGLTSLHINGMHTLTHDRSNEELWGTLRLSEEIYASIRGENKRYQSAHGSWPYMQRFVGITQHLYLLGLNCHIDQVYLKEINQDVSAELLQAVLNDTRPVDLELTSYANSNFLNSQWMKALCAPRSPQTTVLKITIKLLNHTEEDSLGAAIVAIRAAVVSLSLLGLRLYIERVGYTAETKGPGMDSRTRLHLWEPYSWSWTAAPTDHIARLGGVLAKRAADYWVPTEDPRASLAHKHGPPQTLAFISPVMPNPRALSPLVINCFRQLAGAIASLTTRLSSIAMSPIGSRGSQLLKTLRSRLTDADLRFEELEDVGATSTRVKDRDPIYLLKYSKNTLASLELNGGRIANKPKLRIYPRMVSLEIEGRWVPDASVLRRAFPNLSQLISLYGYSAAPPEHGPAGWRAVNRAYQVKHGSWNDMEDFVGPAGDLYLLSPLCRIRRVVDHCGRDDIDAEMLREVLSDARPAQLQLSAFLRPNGNILDQAWMAALTHVRTPQLQTLQVTMKVFKEEDADITEAFDALRAAVAALALLAFSLRIEGFDRPEDDPIEAFIRQLDVSALARSFKDCCRSLKVVSIDLSFPSALPECTVELGSRNDAEKLGLLNWSGDDIQD
ncbi:hypothetical protein OH76DRAFT_1521078 [Lentinus brumalis]|uniref:F-box domain-containing protein n=1 Tax=Lentinus brumalis TaxID=2498619 RepID=A0A371D7H2_9APHY|nr:hypothetical protein OH76DRAFT_1521078 [Polyporus brumalis]